MPKSIRYSSKYIGRYLNTSRTNEKVSIFQRIACFLVPISLAVPIDVGSRIFAAEILLPLIATVTFFTTRQKKQQRQFQVIFLIGLMYLAAQVSSDIWNESTYDQYSRGWARIFIFIVNLISIYILIGNRRSNILLFALGFALGRIIVTLYLMEGDVVPWKIGLAKPFALLVIVILIGIPWLRKRGVLALCIVLVALGLNDIVMDFRSHGFILVTAAGLLFTSIFLRSRIRRRNVVAQRSVIAVSLAGLMAVSLSFQFYVYAAKYGWLSEAATAKYEIQVVEADAPLLVAGRSEVLVYFEAIIDSFVLGHGSWPENRYYADKLAAERFEKGLSQSSQQARDAAIPIHSHLFGSWIEAGVFGGAFWGYILFLISMSLLRSVVGHSHMRPIYLYAALLLLWDVLFSPFSGFRRLETAFLIIVVLRSLLQRNVALSGKRQRFKRTTLRSIHRGRRRKRRRIIGRGAGESAPQPA